MGRTLASSLIPYPMHQACFEYQASTQASIQPACMQRLVYLCCRILLNVPGACLQVNDVAGWSCPRCRDVCNCSNCRKVGPAFQAVATTKHVSLATITCQLYLHAFC